MGVTENGIQNMERGPSVADWGGGMSPDCTAGPTVRRRGRWTVDDGVTDRWTEIIT